MIGSQTAIINHRSRPPKSAKNDQTQTLKPPPIPPFHRKRELLEWLLLTSLQMLEWYRLRRRIEDWFRLLKTECWVEALQRAVTLRAVGTGLGDWPHSPA